MSQKRSCDCCGNPVDHVTHCDGRDLCDMCLGIEYGYDDPTDCVGKTPQPKGE